MEGGATIQDFPVAPGHLVSRLGDGRRNNFDALRLMAALMVIHGHGWVLSGGPGPGLWGVPFARVGLDVFFSISGYLVTGSWERSPRPGPFLLRRARRIFPGLVACVLLTVFVLGPVATRLPLGDYLRDSGTWRYLANIALLNELYLPGVFRSLRDAGAVNGSLWSLLPEFACYLTLPLLAALAANRPAVLAALALLAGGTGMALFYAWSGPAPAFYHLDLKYALVEMPFFFVGAALALLEQRLGARLWRADASLLFFAGNYFISSWLDWWNLPFEWFTLPYMVICFGRLSLPILRSAGRFGDLSFGVYLYAFPVQQLVLAFLPGVGYPVLLCVALSLPLAFLSWHLIERPALRWRWPLRGSARPGPAPEQAAQHVAG